MNITRRQFTGTLGTGLALFNILPNRAHGASDPKIGQPLPPWQQGRLEIHHINTGGGESAFVIMPDGTTLLIDAGDSSRFAPRPERFKSPMKPDNTRPTGEWIGRYIRRAHPERSQGKIDYVLMTHFHADHVCGIRDVAKQIPIQLVLDRGWPDYTDPPRRGLELVQEYREFTDCYIKSGGKVERFVAGSDQQLRQLRAPGEYENFGIRNLAINGEVWTGKENKCVPIFKKGKRVNENNLSAALLIRYGNFTYFNGGDVLRPVEEALADVVGPTDVHVANHHGSEACEKFLQALQPRVHIVQVWDSIQPRPKVFERMLDSDIYPGPRDIFLTNGIWPGRREHLVKKYGEETTAKYMENVKRLTASQGHVVVKAPPGGEKYQVAVLDDTNEELIVKSINEFQTKLETRSNRR